VGKKRLRGRNSEPQRRNEKKKKKKQKNRSKTPNKTARIGGAYKEKSRTDNWESNSKILDRQKRGTQKKTKKKKK